MTVIVKPMPEEPADDADVRRETDLVAVDPRLLRTARPGREAVRAERASVC